MIMSMAFIGISPSQYRLMTKAISTFRLELRQMPARISVRLLMERPVVLVWIPCPELDQHGGIWKFDATKIGLTQKDGTEFATGIRSVVAMDWNAEDKNLYIVMHGRDNLHSLFPSLFTPWQSAMLPSEEFLRVTEGSDFGWPYCFYDQIQQKKVLAPEYGGDGKVIGRCGEMDLPIMGFPGHWAPNDLLFYRGDQFPERYKKGAFIAFHGSTNRAPYSQSGYFVCFVPFENGNPTGEWEVFADGFSGMTRSLIHAMPYTDRLVSLLVPTVHCISQNPIQVRFGASCIRATRIISERNNWHPWNCENHPRTSRHPMRSMITFKRTLPRIKQLYNTFCGVLPSAEWFRCSRPVPFFGGYRLGGGDKKKLINVVLNGLQGPIEVNGETFDGVMPKHAFLNDEDLSTILTYIRQNFGNEASAISPLKFKKAEANQLVAP